LFCRSHRVGCFLLQLFAFSGEGDNLPAPILRIPVAGDQLHFHQSRQYSYYLGGIERERLADLRLLGGGALGEHGEHPVIPHGDAGLTERCLDGIAGQLPQPLQLEERGLV